MTMDEREEICGQLLLIDAAHLNRDQIYRFYALRRSFWKASCQEQFGYASGNDPNHRMDVIESLLRQTYPNIEID